MYKGKLEEGDLDQFSPETIQLMKDEIDEKKRELLSIFATENKINL